jgi:hypothetical protein
MEFHPSKHLYHKTMFIFKFLKFYRFLNIIKFTPIVFMSLRFTTLLYRIASKSLKKTPVFFMLAFSCHVYSQSSSTMGDIKKQADKQFEDEQYSEAYKLYSQLVANYPKDPVYNYRLGVCMIFSEPDKKKCISYLKFAVSNPVDDTKEARFYLGKAYHVNYLFDEAIKNYDEFKKTASSSQLKKLKVDHEIKACANGKHLLSNLTDLEVLSKVQLPENDYFRSYKKIGGKLLVKPDEFKTPVDKKKKEKSVVFLPSGSEVVYFSSYGENTETGKDIYTASRTGGGTYGKPQKVGGSINTEFDEDYPFLHPDGKSLYFASKGHNSMGGYDIFKSTFDEDTGTWGTPVNLEFPINSPDDDYLFVTDSLQKIAYFSTGRQSPPGKIDVLKVKTQRKPIDLLAIKGKVTPGTPEYSLKTTITVKDLFTGIPIGTYESDDDGQYELDLPNGGKLVYTVETPGMETQSAQVTIPQATVSKPYKQTISYENGKLKVLNYFDEAASDDNYLQYLKVIEKKARLDVSEETAGTPVASNNTNDTTLVVKNNPTETKKPQIISQETAGTTTSADPKKGMDNKQLAKMARQDAAESRMEAGQLSRDYLAANETGLKQKKEADDKWEEANDALAKAEAITNEDEKRVAVEKATALKTAAESDRVIADRILALAKSLDEDARNKRKEADLNEQYANELDKAGKTKNKKESVAKLDELQKEISNQGEQKNEAQNLVNEIKGDIDQKEKQITSAEQTLTGIRSNVDEIKTAIGDKENELANTKKKSTKQAISAQISELRADLDEKEKQKAANETELQTLNEELGALKSELDLATKITSGDLAKTTPANASGASEKITSQSLKDKYKDKVAINDANSKSNVEESTTQLTNYNREIDQAILGDKNTLTKTKDAATKKQLNAEITQLEATKKQNQQQVASNNKQLEQLNQNIAKRDEATKNMYEPITAGSGTEAVAKLDKLNTLLSSSDNENFDFNAYQNPNAQSLKLEADARINDAAARQKKLKDDIATSKSEIENPAENAKPVVTVDQLNKEAEEITSRAQKAREEAKTKQGAEKDKLLAEAKDLDGQANNKYVEAAEVIRSDNTAIISTNQENIQNLLKENKSSPENVSIAKNLNDEAKTAFRKAADIRTEANSLTNAGAKLGSFSNAEEKEAEAIQKQQQAIDLLMQSNLMFKLKAPMTSTAALEKSATANPLEEKLKKVNIGLANLAEIKIESYQKLYEANDVEILQLDQSIKSDKALETTPSFKSELISGTNKYENARSLKRDADNASDPNVKLNNLIAAVRKQNETLKQFSALKASMSQVVATNNVSQPNTNTGSENVTPPVTEVPVNNEPVVETTNAASTPTETVSVPSFPEPATNTSAGADSKLVNITELAGQDTSTNQVINYFDSNAPSLRNGQANQAVKTSLSNLKDLEAKSSNVDEEISKLNQLPDTANAPVITPSELKVKADALNAEAEPLNNKAAELKKEAEGKQGEEKSYSLAKARELEIQAQDKMIEAAAFNQQANEAEYKANINAITEMINQLKIDEPDMVAEMEEKRAEYTPLKTQIRNLRDEANALNNKEAKLGAISNAEEKELELIERQKALIAELKQEYPNYVIKPVGNGTAAQKKEDLANIKAQLRENQYNELTNLTNAFSLEYESSKNSVPSNLSAEQQALKQNADDLNSESKRLLIKSSQEKNQNEKIKLLTLAAKSGKTAVDQLNKIAPKVDKDAADLAEIGNRIASSNNEAEPAVNTPANTTVNTKTTAASKTARGATVKIDGLEVINGNAYSTAKPIPIDARMEDGLTFRVQIGAFKTQLPNNSFKGLSPLNGETTNNGYFRYTAGNFNRIENATAVKNDLRGLGYSDAFVVAYFNGKRITIAEAMDMMNREGKTVDLNAPQTAGITANTNVPKAAVTVPVGESVSITKELEQIDGLLYTIQIGVYTKQITKPQLLNLKPIFREQLTNGLYRYTAGIYNNPERLLGDRTKVVELGVKDAFVSAYLNGKRIPFAEGKERQQGDTAIKMEQENPIVFPPVNNQPPAIYSQPATESTSEPVKPFTNNVTNYPSATPENGIKTSEEGISFKVQIGAFSKQVPEDVAAKFSAIKSWPVENKLIGALYVYNIGNFSEAKFAKELKEEVIKMGINDAFITVYKNGKKLYGSEAESYLK